MRTKKQAIREVKSLLSKMKTKGWKIKVWENIGWHYCIYCGRLSVHEFSGKYNAMLSDDYHEEGTTPSYWNHIGIYEDPNKAVDMTLETADTFVKKCAEIVKEVKKNLRRKNAIH